MPKSTSRKDQLIADCVRLATVLGRLRGDGTTQSSTIMTAEYQKKLEGLPVPEIERARGQMELERRRRFTASADTLIRSAGPAVMDFHVRGAGVTVFLQRLDLLEAIQNGANVIPQPLHQRVLEMYDAEDVTDEMLTPAKAAETIQTMRAIVCAVCVQPPAQYYTDVDFGPDQMTEPHTYPRQFVMPGQPCRDGQLPIFVPEFELRADGWRGLKKADLKEIVRATINNGPGAMLGFRLRQESLVALAHDGDDNGEAPERAAGDLVPVGGDRPRSRGKRVRAVGGGTDG